MLEKIRLWLLRWLGASSQTTLVDARENDSFVNDYKDISDINLTTIISSRLANIVTSDSTIGVIGGEKRETLSDGREIRTAEQNERSAYLDAALQKVVERLNLIVARSLAVGGVILRPMIIQGEMHTNILNQNRMTVIKRIGQVITAAAFDAETIIRDNHTFTRMEYHNLDAGVYTIEQKALQDGSEIPLTSVPEWADYQTTTTIKGVKRMLFAFLKCPTDSRRDENDVYGVPITYGNRKLISEIQGMLDEFQREFVNKKTFIGADDRLFTKNRNGDTILPESGKFVLFRSDTPKDSYPFFEVFSPDIRDQSMINGINFKLGLLEKAIGVNHGVLTDLEIADATATAIKRSTLDTFSVVEAMRSNIETAFENLVYAFDVLTNAVDVIPHGEYAISYDWDYSLIEESSERFNQLIQGQGAGVVSPAETRAWVMNLSLDEAERTLPNSDALIEAD